MAIEYTLLCKDRKLSREILVKKIKSMGFSCSKIEQGAEGICIDLSEEIGVGAAPGGCKHRTYRVVRADSYNLHRIIHTD